MHLFDEFFLGEGFSGWYSGALRVNLSVNDFSFINSFGFAIVVVIADLYTFDRLNDFVIAALGSLFFLNGLIYLAASALTVSYSPGTISGVIIYLPVGIIIF